MHYFLTSASLLIYNDRHIVTETGENLSRCPTTHLHMSTKRIPRPTERALAMSASARNGKRKDAREGESTSKKRKTTGQGLHDIRPTQPASKEMPTPDGTDEEQDIVARLDASQRPIEEPRPEKTICIESDTEGLESSDTELGMILYENVNLIAHK